MKIEQIKPSELTPYYNNPRKNDEAVVKVAESIKAFGFQNPIIVDKKKVIIAGHTRFKAALMLNLDSVPVIIADLPEEKAKAYRIADNRVGEFAEWDWEKLEIEIEDFDDDLLELLDFEMPEINEITEGLTDDDEVPEVTESICKPGDLWKLGEHRLFCGDATNTDDVEKLMDGEKADMVFTDPPYGIDYSGGRTQVVKKKEYGKLKNDNLVGEELANLISLVFSYNKAESDVYICVSPIMQTPFLNFIENNGRKVQAVIVWDKGNAGLGYMKYRRQTEFILYIQGGAFKKTDKSDFDLWSIRRDASTTYKHGTQKPVELATRAICNSSKMDDVVLDYFLGSGSTLIACEKTNRKCYGMEIAPHYCDVIIKRWEDYTGNKAELISG